MIDDFNKLHMIAWGVFPFFLIWLVILSIKLRKITAEKNRISRKLVNSDNAVGALSNLIADMDELTRRQMTLAESLKKHQKMINRSIRAVGLVRYDAFNDIGGQFSFSTALLDDTGDGLIITSINGRNEGRVYTKVISGGVASSPLSTEEEEAVAKARSSTSPEKSERVAEMGSSE